LDFESIILTIVLSLIAALAGGFIAWAFKRGERKDSVEKTRIDKSDSERKLAKELRQESEQEAVAVRQEMRDHVDQLLNNLRADIELAKVKATNLDNLQDIKIEQLVKEFVDFKIFQSGVNEKIMKAIEFVQTMLWGPEAKSMPPFMLGETESKEHRDEPGVGAFSGAGKGE
jgi:hypothetical protein